MIALAVLLRDRSFDRKALSNRTAAIRELQPIAIRLGIGGILFARTYERSNSLLAACIEHGLWGDLLFTLGLGWCFYTGVIT